MPATAKKRVRHSKRYLARRRRLLRYALAAAALVIVLLIIFLPRGGKDDPVNNVPSPSPAVTETSEPAPSPTPLAQKFLPIIKSVDTDKKQIAVTVDDLNEVSNLNRIMDIARSNGAKLTLFAIGNVVESKPALQTSLKNAHSWGF